MSLTSDVSSFVPKAMSNPAAASDKEATAPVVSVPAGGFVFRAGDPADAFFLISTGHVELLRRNENHGRLALLAAGDLCGEDAVFEGGRVRAYDARAVHASTLFRVTAETFQHLVQARPELAGAVISALATRLLRARASSLALARHAGHTTGTRGALVHIESGLVFPLADSGDIIVGRADPKFTPDIELSSVDTHRSLSRRHAVIKRSANGDQLVEQPRVANGTFVNGARLSPGVAVPITEGDEISFGLISTVFRTT